MSQATRVNSEFLSSHGQPGSYPGQKSASRKLEIPVTSLPISPEMTA